jgi:putative ABC transport system permease protein
MLRAPNDTVRIAPRVHLSNWWRDVSLAARRCRRSPAFTLTAVLTLALGTGATAAVFSLVNAVLLRPLPWREADSVGLVWAVPPSGDRVWLSPAELQDLQREHSTLSGAAGLTDVLLRCDTCGFRLQAEVRCSGRIPAL